MKSIKTLRDVLNILSHVKYKEGWSFNVKEGAGGFVFSAETPFEHNAYITEWYISGYSTDTEVVRTAYKAVMHIEDSIIKRNNIFGVDDIYGRLSDMEPISTQDELAMYIIKNFEYKDWTLRYDDRGDYVIFQIVFMGADTSDPSRVEEQHCRKFLYNKQPLVKKDQILKLTSAIRYAVQTAEEHECNELFLYDEVKYMLSKIISKEIYNEDGTLNREKVQYHLFESENSDNNRATLDIALYPYVKDDYETFLLENKMSAYTVMESAILFESGWFEMFDLIIYVNAPEDVRIERCTQRSGTTPDQYRSRMRRQIHPGIKMRASDFVIENHGFYDEVKQVDHIHKKITETILLSI